MDELYSEAELSAWYAEISRFIERHSGQDMAQDLVGETFLRFVGHIRRTNQVPRSARSLLYAIARNILKDYYIDSPGRKYHKISDNEPDFDQANYDGYGLLESAGEIARIFAAIDQLPESPRRILRLHIEGFENREIAEKTGYTIENTKRYLRTARIKLLSILARHHLSLYTDERKGLVLYDPDGNLVDHRADYEKWI